MQNTVTTAPLSNLQSAVLETVVYSDLFDFPLTPDEVRRWLPFPATQTELELALNAPQLRSLLAQTSGYVTLPGREDIVSQREARRHSSAALRKSAESYGRLIARLPFVRMVSITGSLAVENADAGDDLDYLIVTAPGRVWLTRAMTMLVVRYGALRGVTVCPNYLLAEDALALPDRDFYTARELRQMVPISGHDVYARMLDANAWWHDHLPNAETPSTQAGASHPSLTQRSVEWLLRRQPFDRAEAWLLERKGSELRRGAGPEAVFDETMCKGHFEGWRERTRRLVDERMKHLLEPSS